MSGSGVRGPGSPGAPRPAIALGLCVGLALAPARARALAWPDVAERVARDLAAPDVATRLAAARRLRSLGPVSGGPLALTALDDPDEEVRLAAAGAAISLRVPAAADRAAEWLSAPSARLRREACEIARALPSPALVAPLARTLGDPDPDVRGAAAQALGRQTAATAVPPLLGRLDDPAPSVRADIADALALLHDPRAVVPLVGKVEDSAAEVRQAVVRALGRLGDPRASAALVLALRDPSADVKQETLAALGRTRAADAVDAIAPFLSERAPRLRLAAIDALGRIGTPDAVRALVAALGSGDEASAGLESTPLRTALVTAGPAAVPALRALLGGSPPGPAATSAAWVLGALHASAEAPAIAAAMRRGVLPVPAALHALAGAGDAAELPVALEFVSDPSPAVRAEALDATLALLDAGPPDGRAVEPLAAALRDAHPSPADRAKLVSALGKTRAARVAPLLAGLARASDPAVRLAAIDALGEVGPAEGAGAPLLEALASADPSVRRRAATALGECGGPAERDALLEKLPGGDGVDRAAVLEALGGILSRAPSEDAVARLAGALPLASGGPRDAVLEALGRTALDSAVRVLADVSRSAYADDRRAAASLAAAHPGSPAALALVRALTDDPDPGVRAQAAWSLGTLGDGSDAARLEELARSPLPDLAGNAAAALARVRARGDRGPGQPAPPARPVLVYVVPPASDEPRPGAPYALLFSDGSVRRGTTDRRGAVFEPAAPPGIIRLR